MRKAFSGVALSTALIGAALAGCSGGSSAPPDGGRPGADGGPASIRDIAYIRESRGILTTEPTGLRNLEALVGGTRNKVTQFMTLDESLCQTRCVITKDQSRFIAVSNNPADKLLSYPMSNLQPNLAQSVQLNEMGKPLANPLFKIISPGNQVLFMQQETGGASGDGGAVPDTYTLASAPIGGGALVKYRNGPFPPSSGFSVSSDGSKILLGEVLGAANQLTIYLYSTGSTQSTLLYRVSEMGSSEFGNEVMELSPDGSYVIVATLNMGRKVLMKVTTDGRTTQPPMLAIGPRECAAAGPSDICTIQSPLYFSADGSTVYFLGGREVGVDIVSQLYAVSTSLSSPPQALSAFPNEVPSLAINRARDRVIWSTEAGPLKKNFAIFGLSFSGAMLTGTPDTVVDDPSISFHFQEAYFLE
jgi:hypothetical protein